jgi:hypothetical protein
MWISTFQTPFVEEAVFSPACFWWESDGCGCVVYILWPSVLFHCSMFLFSCLHHAVFAAVRGLFLKSCEIANSLLFW